MNKKWVRKKIDKNIVENLAKDLGVDKIISHLLVLRGIKTFAEAECFFRPKISHLHDPFLMKNMSTAVARIETAIIKKQKILV